MMIATKTTHRIFVLALLIILSIFISSIGFAQVDSQTARRIVKGTALPATCNVGDVFFKTTASIGTYQCTAVNTYTQFASGGGTGDVVGPASSVAGEVVIFDGITGKLLKSSGGFIFPTTDGSANDCIKTNGSKVLSFAACGGGITIGTTAITSGTTKRLLFDSAGVVGEAAGFEYQAGASPNVLIAAQDDSYAALSVRPFSAAAAVAAFQVLGADGSSFEVDPTGNSPFFAKLTQLAANTYPYLVIVNPTASASAEGVELDGDVSSTVLSNNNSGNGGSFISDIPNSGVLQVIGGSLVFNTSTGSQPIIFATDGPGLNNEKGRFDTNGFRLGIPSSITGKLNLAVSGSANVTTLQAGDTPASAVMYKWPADNPTAGDVLTVTSFGGGIAVLEWAAGGGTTINATNGVVPYRSDATTFLDSPVSIVAGRITITPTLQSSGTAKYWRLITPVDTGQTASTEVIGAQFGGDTSVATVTRQWATGALTTQRENVFVAPTYSFVGASTLTTAATVAITAAPVAGTNATITNPYALLISSGLLGIDPTNTGDKIAIYRSGSVTAYLGMANLGPYLSTYAGGNIYLRDAAAGDWATFSATGSTIATVDTSASSVPSALILRHTSSVFGTNGVGVKLDFLAYTTTSLTTLPASISAIWTDATHASRSAALVFSIVHNAGSLTEVARFSSAIQFTPQVRTSGVASYFQVVTPADTTLTASTESIGMQYGGDTSAATVTRQWATGALTTQRENVFVNPTYDFVGATTLTNAATVAIAAAPVAGTNATITNSYALWVQGGASRFDGTISAAGSVIIGGGTAIAKVLSATASLDFGATAAGACDLLTITVTGAADGDPVFLGIPTALAASDNYQEFTGYVSAADTVTVKRCNLTNLTTALSNPAAATVRATVFKH